MLCEKELAHDLGEQSATGEQAKEVVVDALHGGEVEVKCAVELLNHQFCHLLHVALGGKACCESCCESQLLAQIGDLATSGEIADSRFGAVAAQGLRAPAALVGAGTVGAIGCELRHESGHRPEVVFSEALAASGERSSAHRGFAWETAAPFSH